MNERILEKIRDVKVFLGQLEEFTPHSLEEYSSNAKDRAACERLFEKIIEALVDIGFLLVKERKLKIPEDDKQVFIVLAGARIITEEASRKLQEAKGMRNILAHDYGKINDELVYYSLQREIIPDVEVFLNQIEEFLK